MTTILLIVSIFAWTYSSNCTTSITFIKAFLLLLAVSIIVTVLGEFKKSINHSTYRCLCIVLVLLSFGTSIQCRTGNESHISGFFTDIIIMIIVFITTFLLVRYTSIYRIKYLAYFFIIALPFSLLFALTKEPSSGAYTISFFGLQIVGIILIGFPFVISYYMSKCHDNLRYLAQLPTSLVRLLIYTVFLFLCSALCNEFSIIFIIGIITIILFWTNCPSIRLRILFIGTIIIGALLSIRNVYHLRERVAVLLNLPSLVSSEDYSQVGGSTFYLYKTFHSTGFWGNGIGSLSTSIIPTLRNDHVLFTLEYDYSLIIAVFIVILGMLLAKEMLIRFDRKSTGKFDYYFCLSTGLIMITMILLNTTSNLGSFITTGIGFPFISDGGTINLALTIHLAVHCAISERNKKDKEETYAFKNTQEWR